MIRDLGSLNGTFLGSTRITGATVVPPGGKITIGAVTFQAVYGDMPTEDENSSLGHLATPAVAAPLEQTLELGELDSPETEFLASEEPASTGDDDDMSDFFASLK
jgi:pSer/pThr/pTyr-binding forkhead associated (FHA) protein